MIDERAALIADAERADEFATNRLSEDHWKPSRAQYETLRNHVRRLADALSSSPPAAGWNSVAPSLGNSEADALTQLLEAIEADLAQRLENATVVAAGDHPDTWGAAWTDGLRVGYRNALAVIREARAWPSDAVRLAESKAQDGSSLLNPPDPILSNGEKP